MAVAARTISVSDEDHESITLQPGDDVPSWAEQYLKDEWIDRGDHPGAAGTDLYEDPIYMAAVMAAGKVGLEVSDIEGLSAEQIASLVRTKRRDQETVEEAGGEDNLDEDADPGNMDPMKRIFQQHNEGGNVNAPDAPEKKPRAKSSPSSSQSGGGSGSGV